MTSSESPPATEVNAATREFSDPASFSSRASPRPSRDAGDAVLLTLLTPTAAGIYQGGKRGWPDG